MITFMWRYSGQRSYFLVKVNVPNINVDVPDVKLNIPVVKDNVSPMNFQYQYLSDQASTCDHLVYKSMIYQ